MLTFLSSTAEQLPDASSTSPNGSSDAKKWENTTRHLSAINLSDSPRKPSFKLVNTSTITLDTERTLSLEEKLRRERQRMQGTGVTNYEWGGEGERVVVPLDGNVYVQDGRDGSLRCVYNKDLFSTASSSSSMSDESTSKSGVVGRDSSAIDPHLSPTSSHVAFVIAGDIYTVSASSTKPNSTLRRVTFGGSVDGVMCGLADFIAQEEMDRYRGYWWEPEGKGIAFQEVREEHIPEFRISHSGSSETGGAAVEDHR